MVIPVDKVDNRVGDCTRGESISGNRGYTEGSESVLIGCLAGNDQFTNHPDDSKPTLNLRRSRSRREEVYYGLPTDSYSGSDGADIKPKSLPAPAAAS